MSTQAGNMNPTWSRLAGSDQACPVNEVPVAEVGGAHCALVRIGEALSVATVGPICVMLGAGDFEHSEAAAAATAVLDVSSQP